MFNGLVLLEKDPGLGLYLYGGGVFLVVAWFYFMEKYANVLIKVSIHR